MSNTEDALRAAIKRVRDEVLPRYEGVTYGDFRPSSVAQFIRNDVKLAENALERGEAAMRGALVVLQGYN